jgi:hypothetical protein
MRSGLLFYFIYHLCGKIRQAKPEKITQPQNGLKNKKLSIDNQLVAFLHKQAAQTILSLDFKLSKVMFFNMSFLLR